MTPAGAASTHNPPSGPRRAGTPERRLRSDHSLKRRAGAGGEEDGLAKVQRGLGGAEVLREGADVLELDAGEQRPGPRHGVRQARLKVPPGKAAVILASAAEGG